MLFWLTDHLNHYYHGFNVFHYLTFRTILSILTAFCISLVVGPFMIRRLAENQIGQTVRNDGPKSHMAKAGTPTMGGTLILVAIVLTVLLWGDLNNHYVWLVMLVTVAFGSIGWVDDFRKLVEKDSRGLPARWKYLWQSILGFSVAIFLFYSASSPLQTELIVPFFKQISIQLGIFYILFTYFVVVGASNAVNLTDGLDGLAILPTVMVGGGFRNFCVSDR